MHARVKFNLLIPDYMEQSFSRAKKIAIVFLIISSSAIFCNLDEICFIL